MNDPDPTEGHKPEPPAGQDETVDDAHPSDDQLAHFVTGRLAESESSEIEPHLESCSECIVTIKQLRTGVVGRVDTLLLNQSKVGNLNETVDHAAPSTLGSNATVSPPAPSFGDYELIDEIARGGMGVVYKARQMSLNRVVALKMIKSGEFANQEQVDRFYKEAEAAANLDHPGIVPVHEVGEVDGQHYFTMGFVDGDSLADRLREGPLPPKEAAQFAKSIAEAVAYAHSKGVIHRDLKPGNVLITKNGQLRITDFGLAKRIEEDSELTSTGQVLGTPSYMPPEQAAGRLSEIGPAADVYAIGATLYCTLVGRPPFQAANVIETLQQVIETEPVSLRVQNPALTTDLETLCLKCLEKNTKSRYPSAQELVDELNRFLNGEPIVARPIGRVERMARWCKRKPVAASLLGAIVILAIGGPWAAIAQSLAERRTAMARVDTLLNAGPASIPVVLEELDRNASIVDSRLRELDAQDLLPRQRIRVSLALLPFDSNQIGKLKQRINNCTYDELEVLLDRAKAHGGSNIVPELWTTFRDNTLSEDARFRTGIALSALDPDSEQWRKNDYDFLVTSMFAVNTVYQPAIRRSLRPIASRLVPAIREAYRTATPGTLADESSANAIVDLAATNRELLTQLSIVASPKQHSILFPVVAEDNRGNTSFFDQLVQIAKQQPSPDDDETRRIRLGKRRSGAAINLVRLGRQEEALEALRIREDPESLTQFVHGCKARGVIVGDLLDLLNRASTVSERYGILLALGEFEVTDIPQAIRSTWVEFLKALYANDPSSGIHGASGWLLRHWGLTGEAKAIEEREVPYNADREWFTIKINLATPFELEHYSYFTFVVFSAGVYQVGSPEYENDRSSVEVIRRVEVGQFALLDREVTRKEFVAFESRYAGPIARYSPTLDSAVIGVNWYDAVRFCRWLTLRRGMSELDQCYPDPTVLDKREFPVDPNAAADGMPRNWPVEMSKTGFRLPTEIEWESACRGGMVSRYSFGCDERLHPWYIWYHLNSGRQAHPVRTLRPNLRGMFDMNGNVWEWCNNWGGNLRQSRVSRGGGWSSTADVLRSAYINSGQPASRSDSSGFRLALTPSPSNSRE